jgi:hypothetical protein
MGFLAAMLLVFILQQTTLFQQQAADTSLTEFKAIERSAS